MHTMTPFNSFVFVIVKETYAQSNENTSVWQRRKAGSVCVLKLIRNKIMCMCSCNARRKLRCAHGTRYLSSIKSSSSCRIALSRA